MLPLLESTSFFYKAFANIDSFPITFDSRLINSEDKLLNLLKSLNPSTEIVELYEVDKKYYQNLTNNPEEATKDLKMLIVLPEVRQVIAKAFKKLKH